jgi:hypothetical protein
MYPQDFEYGGISVKTNYQIPSDFPEWIDRCLDGTITPEQFALLDEEIATNDGARDYYLEFITTYVGLMDLQGVLPKTFEIPWQDILFRTDEEHAASQKTGHLYPYHFGPDVTEEERRRQIEIYAREQLDAYLREQHKDITQQKHAGSGGDILEALDSTAKTVTTFFRTGLKAAKITAACSLVLLLLILPFYKIFTPREIATLSTSLDAQLSENETVVSGMRLTNRKDSTFLRTGLIEILFDGGAKVLLEAPAAFRLKSADRMVLHQGQLFAYVPDYAQGFTVETPNSQIIDMGTEFGIRVEQDGTSDLHMFKGKAALALDSISGTKQTMSLAAGQAKRINTNRQVKDIPIKEEAFVRLFDSNTEFVWRGQKLSLADIIGHGNGLGGGQMNVYIDPIEGYKDSIDCSAKGNEYHTLATSPFIDGLFIPDGNMKQIVSSQAHEFVDCPKTTGECYNTLVANPNQGIDYDSSSNLAIRVVDPSAQGTPAFILADETYVVTGNETGIELMPENRSSDKLGTGTWVRFEFGTPIQLMANKQYGFDVTVTLGNRTYCFETAGVVGDSYTGGFAYSTGTKGGTNSFNLDEVYNGDHTFIVELSQINPEAGYSDIEPTQDNPKISYRATSPELGPDDVAFLRESTIDNQNVGGFPEQIYSVDNDHATYIARDRRGLGQTFTTGSNPDGYLMKDFWLKNVSYTKNLSGGNGTWWYVGTTDKQNGVIRFEGQDYGNREHPCIVMQANLGITFNLDAIRSMCPGTEVSRFVSEFGIADLEEPRDCNADFWVLIDGQVRQSRQNITQKNISSNISIGLNPTDRFLTLVTTDGGDIDRMRTYQRAYNWCVFVEPELILKKEESTVNMQIK